jgi:hypothetical protein
VEGVNIGDKYHTKHFIKEAEFLAARCVQHYDACDLRQKLGGLGIPSSMAILLDGIPVGGISLYGRHGNVTVICVSSVSPHTHRLHSRLVGWCVQKSGHGGAETAAAVLDTLCKEPLALTRSDLRSCLSCVGGDGAVVRGGADRTLPGTQAGEILWKSVYGPGPATNGDWMQDTDYLHAATE